MVKIRGRMESKGWATLQQTDNLLKDLVSGHLRGQVSLWSPCAVVVLFSANTDCTVVLVDLRKCSQVSALTQFWGICVGFQKCIHGHSFESLRSVLTLENRMYVWLAYAFDICFWKGPSHLSKLSFILSKLSYNKFLLSSFLCVCATRLDRDTEMNGILPCHWRGRYVTGVRTKRTRSQAATVPGLLFESEKVTSCLRKSDWAFLMFAAYSRQGYFCIKHLSSSV